MNGSNIVSPVTGSGKVRLISSFPTVELITQYHRIFQIDVSPYFKDAKEISIFECEESGYRFFYPFTVDGDALFYQQLQKIDWYYQDSKWEYDILSGLINDGDSVLEIGCGKGAFLRKIKGKGLSIGLELNDDVVKENDDITILNKTIQKFVKDDDRKFDWVISFQVLEHISDVKNFIQDSIRALKPGGHLVVVVPNNNAYFFSHRNMGFDNQEYQKSLLLNSPPHHMGLWNDMTIRFLTKQFEFAGVRQFIEPISPWRKELNKLILREKHKNIYRILARFVPETFLLKILSKFDKTLLYGDSIVSVFQKPK